MPCQSTAAAWLSHNHQKVPKMPRLSYKLATVLLLLTASPSFAADDVVMFPVASAINTPEALQKLSNSVKFYFGAQPVPQTVQSFGQFVSNRKTNGFAKSAAVACQRAFLSALISLHQRADELGGNAVIHIESYYRKHAVVSDTQYECHKGFLIAGVALRGEVVRLADH
jgi:uncharacterized protein YbjQ (UPF0145 family)